MSFQFENFISCPSFSFDLIITHKHLKLCSKSHRTFYATPNYCIHNLYTGPADWYREFLPVWNQHLSYCQSVSSSLICLFQAKLVFQANSLWWRGCRWSWPFFRQNVADCFSVVSQQDTMCVLSMIRAIIQKSFVFSFFFFLTCFRPGCCVAAL